MAARAHILAAVLLTFGSTRLPAQARGVGQSMKIFRSEVKSVRVEAEPSAEADINPKPQPVEAP